ncbi:MAG: hypothetical protein ACLPN5_19260 [Roseiarcus sp.]
MTRKQAELRDERVKSELSAEVRRMLGADRVVDVRVTPRENFSGEPVIYVFVSLKSVNEVPSSALQKELTSRMFDLLEDLGDERSPRLSFDAPDDVFAEPEEIEFLDDDE